jgi:hypothetical protein
MIDQSSTSREGTWATLTDCTCEDVQYYCAACGADLLHNGSCGAGCTDEVSQTRCGAEAHGVAQDEAELDARINAQLAQSQGA